jgi:undecaprenyl diphosphate synthase
MKGDAVFSVFRRWFRGARREQDLTLPVPTQNLPRHVAIIMDGNGRWARRRGLPRAAGHHAGMLAMREVIRASDDAGIEFLTLYAFSTENWKRPQSEVEYLMRLPEEFFRTEIDELVDRGVRVRFIGDVSKLPPYTQDTVQRTLSRTQGNNGMIVTFALNYGGRADVLGAVRRFAEDVRDGRADWDRLSEEEFSMRLDTAGLPDPDLVIRTSGEQRLSNFLIWQAAYAEFWFTDVLWPDFGRAELFQALADYGRRKRRFGGLK